MSDIFIGVVLGLIEGITEFLPVSSTGHLILAGHALNFTGVRAESFEIFIQLGAIIAVVLLYWRRFLGLLDFKTSSVTEFRGFPGLIKIAAACAPAFVLGALSHDAIKEHLFSPFTVALGFVMGALLIIFVERIFRRGRTIVLEALTVRQCIGIGFFQCLALWPGMSRSASTIIGGMLVGASRSVAAEFSFIVAVPVMFAATLLDLYKSLPFLTVADIPLFATGFIVSFLSALLAIRVFIRFVGNNSLVPFAYYRLILGIVIIIALGKF